MSSQPATPPAESGASALDEASLRAVVAREPVAVERWYRAEHPRVWRRCFGLCGSRADADDLAQDAMLELHDALARRDPRTPYAAWSARVVLNLCRDRWRRVAARQRAEDEARRRRPEEPVPDPSAALAQGELRQALGAVLERLPEREREAFVLCELEQLSTADVAHAMQIGESSVRSLCTLARRRLRGLLAAHAEGADDGHTDCEVPRG
jgi:RNA polymerase sigma-70 factor (ECF subfamily)